jgi:NTE family protein
MFKNFSLFLVAIALVTSCQELTLRHEAPSATVANAHNQDSSKAKPIAKIVPLGTSPAPTPFVNPTPVPAVITPPNTVVEIPLPKESPRVGIILGPGGMRSFAHIGVLKEFARARIPINSIIGLEWGALMAGLYAVQGQVNELEFKAMRMRESDVPGKGFLGSRIKPENISLFTDFLNQVFGNALFEKTKVEFACPTYNFNQDRTVFLGRGSIRDGLTKCLPYPPYFVENKSSMAAPFEVEEAANFMRARNINLVIFVNVLAKGDLFPKAVRADYKAEELLYSELRRELNKAKINGVNQIIEVNTAKSSMIDFEARRDLIEEGAQAAKETVNKLVNQYGF